MAGFFRKVASAFVEIEDDGSQGGHGRTGDRLDLDDITKGTSELLAQLEEIQDTESGTARSGSAATVSPPTSAPIGPPGGLSSSPRTATDAPGDGAAAATNPGMTAASGRAAVSPIMTMTAEEVFQLAGIPDGPNSASRVLKLIAGLAMFPPEQQVIMLRAMDAADDTWSEPEVLDDARRRQAALRNHLQVLQEERDRQIQDIDARIAQAEEQGQLVLADIDRQLEELQKQRAAAITGTTTAIDDLKHEKQEIENQGEHARHGITHVINALSNLLTFFAGGKSGPPGATK